MTFVIWLSKLLLPSLKGGGEYIYNEGDEIHGIWFFINGGVEYVLPRYANIGYIKLERGEMFGVSDIYLSMSSANIPAEEWFNNK